MATIKLARSTSCSRCINYAEPRATVKSGFNCDVNYAKTQMKATRMIYGKFGVNLQRVSRDQARQGTYIPMSDIQPGDMLYFGQSRVTHVGIYIGDGKMIHAPKPGDYVRISSISWHVETYKIQGGRRFVK